MFVWEYFGLSEQCRYSMLWRRGAETAEEIFGDLVVDWMSSGSFHQWTTSGRYHGLGTKVLAFHGFLQTDMGGTGQAIGDSPGRRHSL